jgi:hypothetical protein
MKPVDFAVIKKMEKLGRINGPLIQTLNERWPSPDERDENYLYTLKCVQEITQMTLDLVTAGLL